MVRSHSRKKFGQRNGIASTVIVAVVVVIIVIIAAGAFIALSPGKTVTSVVTTGTTAVVTSGVTSIVSTTVSASGASNCGAATETLNGAGGTLVFPLMSAWTFAYPQVCPNVHVNYASVGSGAGIAQITARTVDFGESDAPLSVTQYSGIKNGTLMTIPVSASAVVPAYNIPGVPTGLNFTGAVLANIFLGNITVWNDPAIVALNPKANLTSHAITVVHRSDGSGTMYAFTNYLSDASSVWKTKVGKATSVNWPVGVGCKGNEGVAGCVSNTPYSIGPLEIAYEIVNKNLISYGAVRNAAGNNILANINDTQAAIQAGGTSGLPPGYAHWTSVSIIDSIFNNTQATTAYPITTFTYGLVYQQQTDQAKGTALVGFFWWVVNSGQAAGSSIGYVPLPSNVVTLDDATLNNITYNGTPLHTGM
ncbi:MAG: phosphate ABC transporter substrate-binding protein PstS [Thaumarchaeota archaeon]|nr:phosphate ABC transporter substrate-binding protein PstS [Nitrososphaerota archaeon]